jgi:RNA-directed DNA polymerase
MRVAQYRILTRILDKVSIPDYIHGFETGKSIPKMAQSHVGKDVVISLDIKEFFPSIRQYMVKAMLIQMGIEDTAATVLSELCTYKYYVPQGSLTAPKISNIVAAGTFGPAIEAFCKPLGITMTIYADDITLSYTNDAPSLEEAKAFTRAVITFVTEQVKAAGFEINKAKTKIMRPHNRQWVCGAVVNQKVNMRKKERMSLRALVHNCSINGVEVEAKKSNLPTEAFIRKYAGRINWFHQLNPTAGLPLKLGFKTESDKFLKHHPDVVIPELAWQSIENPTPETLSPTGFLETTGDFKVTTPTQSTPSFLPDAIEKKVLETCPF